MNAYETGERKLIPASLIYARLGGKTLMLHRNVRGRSDLHHGKWNGIGGKFEPGESPLQAARREFEEETGLALPEEAFRSAGLLHFPEFNADKSQDWAVWVFTVEVPSDKEHFRFQCAEGELHWIENAKLLDLNLWEGDRDFLPLVLRDEPFTATFWYRDGKLLRSWIESLRRPARPS